MRFCGRLFFFVITAYSNFRSTVANPNSSSPGLECSGCPGSCPGSFRGLIENMEILHCLALYWSFIFRNIFNRVFQDGDSTILHHRALVRSSFVGLKSGSPDFYNLRDYWKLHRPLFLISAPRRILKILERNSRTTKYLWGIIWGNLQLSTNLESWKLRVPDFLDFLKIELRIT